MRVAQVGISVFVFVALANAQDFFPLQAGNSWTYRSADGRETKEVKVGTPVTTDAAVWYPVTGLGSNRILVTRTSNGTVLGLDPATGEKQALLQLSGSYTSASGQPATVSEHRIGYQG